MRKTVTMISGLALAASLALSAFPQTPAPKPASTQAKMTNKKAAPKTDSEMQACIQEKLAASSKLKDQGFNVSVTNGKATFTGMAKNASSKGSVHGIAKSCGCKQIVNNITVQSAAKTKT